MNDLRVRIEKHINHKRRDTQQSSSFEAQNNFLAWSLDRNAYGWNALWWHNNTT